MGNCEDCDRRDRDRLTVESRRVRPSASGVAHIYASFNDTFVHATGPARFCQGGFVQTGQDFRHCMWSFILFVLPKKRMQKKDAKNGFGRA